MENPLKNNPIKNLVKGAAIATTLAFTPAANDLQAQQPDRQEQNITSKVKWANEAISKANSELKYIKTAEDARAYAIKMAKFFTSKIGPLTEEQFTNVNYSLEEYIYLLEEANKMQKILQDLDEKYQISRASSLDKVIYLLNNRSTYAGYNKYNMVKNIKNE